MTVQALGRYGVRVIWPSPASYRMTLVGVISLSFISLLGCAPAPAPPAEEGQSTEADLAAVEKLEADVVAAVNRGDADALAAMMTQDIVEMPPNSPAIVGREAAAAFWAETFGEYIVEASVSTAEVVVAGDWAFVRATSQVRTTPKAGGEAARSHGKHIHMFLRQPDGSWKYARDIWNSDEPPPEG